MFCCLPLLRRYNILTRWTLGPLALGAIGPFVLDKEPRRGNRLAAVRTATEGRFVRVHGSVGVFGLLVR